jgi:anionic cell wall polymer biosynthesis LytR-Cps2A-Psr (LCP) family protein
MDIQYGVNVNYTVMRDLVSALGGITVTIESRDPRGQMDSNFDWKCGVGDPKVSRAEELRRCPPSGHYIDYPNGPVNLDAEHALYLAQARGDLAPTYGFEQSNFDREKNQQKIVKAIREKAMSAGVLADFGKVSNILDALGNNMRTTFATNEVRTLVSLAKDIKDADIKSLSFIDGDPPLMTGNAQPTAGMYQFSDIKAFIAKNLSSNPVAREGAKIAVFNGSETAGVAQTEADKLTSAGFTVSAVDNAPEGTYADVEIYQIGSGNTATKAKLESMFNVKTKTTEPPVTVADGTNFVVIFGKARSTE